MKNNVAVLVCLLACIFSRSYANEDRDRKLLEAGAPGVVLQLEKWPDEKKIKNNVSLSVDVAPKAKRSIEYWVKRVFDPAWLPGSDMDIFYLNNEFEGRDVCRMRWKVDGCSVEVSQTKSIFIAKIIFPDRLSQGSVQGSSENMFMKIFPQTPRKEPTRLGRRQPINLADVAVWLTLRDQQCIHLEDGTMVWSGQLISPQLEKNVVDYSMDWFEVLGCWNDGSSMVVYFEKPSAGSRDFTRADYRPQKDHGWFASE
jgi:hypothetical protein